MTETTATATVDFSVIEHNGLRFVVSGTPREDTVDAFVAVWKAQHVRRVVRACEATYDAEDRPRTEGISVHDICSRDGDVPTAQSIEEWHMVVADVFGPPKKRKPAAAEAIAVHCVAGLGRSPLLVAVSLMEYGLGDALEAIQFVRAKRPGALNIPQIAFLKSYKPHGGKCTIS
jgi:protein tyrosine phosphatase type 4A